MWNIWFPACVPISFPSIPVAINVKLPLCIWVVLDESLWVRSETTASVVQSEGANVTVLLSFAINSSRLRCRRHFSDVFILRVISWLRQWVSFGGVHGSLCLRR